MKTKTVLLFILINLMFIGCSKNVNIDKNKNENITFFFFPISTPRINNKILNFMSEFISYTEKEFGKNEKYTLYLENLIGDRHLITMSLMPKNENIDIKKFNGVFRFQNKLVFFSLLTKSIFESNSKEEIRINDYKYFYWQLIIINNEGTINKVRTMSNDTLYENSNPIITKITELKPNSFDTKPLEEKVKFKQPLNK